MSCRIYSISKLSDTPIWKHQYLFHFWTRKKQNIPEIVNCPNAEITQLSSPGVNLFLNPREHSFYAYEPYSAETLVPIPLLKEEELKYSRLPKCGNITQLSSPGLIHFWIPRALILCLRTLFRWNISTYSTAERGRTKKFPKLWTAQMQRDITQLSSPEVDLFLNPPWTALQIQWIVSCWQSVMRLRCTHIQYAHNMDLQSIPDMPDAIISSSLRPPLVNKMPKH
jgi:hypothetical protein